MKSITFSQALLAAGIVGLTLSLTQGWYAVAALQLLYSESVASGWTHAAAVLQGVSFATPLATIAVAVRRHDGGPAMTFPQLLAVTGLFGLMLASMLAPLTPLVAQGFDSAGEGGPSIAGGILAQAIAFAIPVVVLVVAWRRSASGDPDQPDEAVDLPRLVTAFALLGLMFAAAAAPSPILNFFRAEWYGRSFDPAYAVGLAVMVVGGLILLSVIALWSKRVRASVGTTTSPWLLAMVSLLVLGCVTVVENSDVAEFAGGLQLPVAFLVVLGIFWANSLASADGEGVPADLLLGRVLLGVGLAGVVLTSTTLLPLFNLLPPLEWHGDLAVPAFVTTGISGLVNLVVLALGVRKVRNGVAGGGHAVPRAQAQRARFITAEQASESAGQLGFTVTLIGATAAIGLFWSASSGPSIGIPIVLLLFALVVPLAIAAAPGNAFGDPVGGRAIPDESHGLSFSGLVTVTGFLGLVLVTALSPLTALSISATVWQGDGPWRTMLALQVVAFLVPLAIIAAARVRARQAAKSPDGDWDAITLPRLALCLGLIGVALVASSLPELPNDLLPSDTGMTSISSDPTTWIHLSSGGAVLLAALVVFLGGGSRLAALVTSAPAPVTAGVVALGAITIVGSYGGADVSALILVGLAVVALLWFRSDGDPSSATAATIAAWRAACIPLLGLALLVPATPQLAAALAANPAHWYPILTMLFLGLAYCVNILSLREAFLQLRAAAWEPPPASPASPASTGRRPGGSRQ